jgi:NitT/TauT family transport system substrate-binding protein
MAIRLSENFRALFYAPFYSAEATGAFREAGVEVQLVPSPEPAAAVRALLAGEVDVMWGGPLRVMISHDKDPASTLVCFCDVVARDPFFIVGRMPNENFRFGDLRMLKFASVSEVPTPWICLADDIRRAGVAPDGLQRNYTRTMAENEAALRAGTVDAIQVFQPYAERLVRSGAGHIWHAAANRGLTAYTTLVTRRETLTARRDELLRMTRAVHRTLQWFARAPVQEITGLLRPYFADVPEELFAQCIERYRALQIWNQNPVIQREGYDRLHAAMRAAGTIGKDIPFAATVDTELAREAMKAAGR